MKRKILCFATFGVACFMLISCENEQRDEAQDVTADVAKVSSLNNRQSGEVVISYSYQGMRNVIRSFDLSDIVTKSIYDAKDSLINEYGFFVAYDAIPALNIVNVDSVNHTIS